MSRPVVFAAFALVLASPAWGDAVASTGPGDLAQGMAGRWNGPRALELIDRTVERRAGWTARGGLEDYTARARGHIYFLYDLGRNTERHLIKADLLALEVYWQAPGRNRQLIVGRQERKVLPTNIRYHLDHLTVVMDNYGDRIFMGEGAEVRDVLHPAAAGAVDVYEYRLADSLTLMLPDREVRVYRLMVRPRDPGLPGVVGSLYVDRGTADIVKMDFTFTAAAYIDETIDYINVQLENALWHGRHWLPYRQSVELRREFPVLNFPAGSVIRAELGIRDYEFNSGLPSGFFNGPSVASLPRSRLDEFEFDAGLYDALDPQVAVTPPSLEEIRQEATRMVSESYLQNVRPFRLAVSGASSVLRFRRAEGLYVGPGFSFGFPRGGELLLLGGYAVGAERFEFDGRLTGPVMGSVRLDMSVYIDRVEDAAPWPASSGAVATLAAALDGEDYREPYWSSGAGLKLGWPWLGGRASAGFSYEEWEAADLAADRVVGDHRRVRVLDEGEVVSFELRLERPSVAGVEAVGGASWALGLEAASPSVGGEFEYVFATARAEYVWTDVAGLDVRLAGAAGAAGGGRLPAQRLFPAGGRGTVRGYDFHRFIGNLYGAGSLELARSIAYPIVSAVAFADVGWTGIEGNSGRRAVEVWNEAGTAAEASDGVLVSAGAGLGLFFDIIRVELARGLRQDGAWELIFRARREFWDWL
ncbi:MAG: BamA/TamA family outer membrane protein [Gemmatimonadetes bacterium]|uniref:BamA/TamA family outer membrane protein n=1 Tax=Candidatus Kutchimonas denitrificans TaxID=3056748 RepID=A0AAE4ZAA2_9BACT|nr:BamA/TamA family outer membrane protein [Gemmatimonadota bacterium]NIR73675.1 BamA/TamA family outer membrane protein [Candidatus Kutchimonas denitrificans]NIS00725.1 BamA/TamA family outer membrane protein [Gemmatimonadota bacterium]NIT66312.1 BamA/TamA family outer membrane protein [Gemmatimonadota bacterium]NIU51530.1 BamA/TamA family outer membrane protein [Gemmatimonadota bacterium]